MKIYKIASTESDIRDLRSDLRSLKDDIRGLKKDSSDFERKIKKMEKTIDDLNIGSRRIFQQTSIFTSLQRKLERFEKVEDEWKKYKAEMDEEIKKLIEKRTKADVKV